MMNETSPPQNPRVALREVTAEDLPVFYEHQSDLDACRMAQFASRDHGEFMAHWAKILVDDSVRIMTVVYDGRVAGNVASWLQGDRRLIGYWFGKEYWGKGIATRAVAEYVRLVVDRPLFAHVAVSHVASIRVLEKCGFVLDDASNEPSPAPADGVQEVVMKLEADSPLEQK